MKARKWTEMEDRSLLAGYRGGELIDSLMERLKLRRSAIYRRLSVLKEPPREPRKRSGDMRRTYLLPYEQAGRLVHKIFSEARDQGLSMPELAAGSNVCPETLHIWNRGQGDPLLSNLEAVGLAVEMRLVWEKIT